MFGFSVGDFVGWVSSDSDVPLGSQGKVIEFNVGGVVVKFSSGEYRFPPSVLYHVGVRAHGFMLGDLVDWVSRDSTFQQCRMDRLV